MVKSKKTIAFGIGYEADVFNALSEMANRHFKGNRNRAQNHINRFGL